MPFWFGDLDGDGQAEYVTQEEKGVGEDAGMREKMRAAKLPRFTYRLHCSRADLGMEPTPYQQFEAEGYALGEGEGSGDGGSEDVVQEALFQAYRMLDSFDDSRPLAPWLFRIAHNRCIDFLRRREVRENAEAALAEPDPVMPVEPPGPALGRAVEHLVMHLPPKERACVLLKDVFDYSLEESAELADSTVGGVKAALHRGRARLPAPAERKASRPAKDAATEQLLHLYVERFNRRDWDGLRELIAEVLCVGCLVFMATKHAVRWMTVRRIS